MPITAPDGDLYVSPLYLASCTITGDPAFAPLLDGGGPTARRCERLPQFALL